MLRRAPFKRPAFQRPPLSPVKPIEGCRGVYTRASDVVVAVPKVLPVRSEAYRRWVASLPCMACGIEGYSQAAHPNFGRGLGQKASDLDCFPLCATRPGHMGHHAELDQLVEMTLEERRGFERAYIERTHALARAAGRKEIL